MTPHEREIIFKVADDVNEALMPIYLIRKACSLCKEQDFMRIMCWFDRNNIRGLTFLHWYKSKEGTINAIAHARKEVLRDLGVRRVFAKEMI